MLLRRKPKYWDDDKLRLPSLVPQLTLHRRFKQILGSSLLTLETPMSLVTNVFDFSNLFTCFQKKKKTSSTPIKMALQAGSQYQQNIIAMVENNNKIHHCD